MSGVRGFCSSRALSARALMKPGKPNGRGGASLLKAVGTFPHGRLRGRPRAFLGQRCLLGPPSWRRRPGQRSQGRGRGVHRGGVGHVEGFGRLQSQVSDTREAFHLGSRRVCLLFSPAWFVLPGCGSVCVSVKGMLMPEERRWFIA